MLIFLIRRIGLAIVTLFLLTIIVFALSNVLPGDVGRQIMGPFAPQASVDELNKRLGTDQPLYTQYLKRMEGYAQLDLGESYKTREPVSKVIGTTFLNSAKLAFLALLITVPLGILGGIIAALKRGSLIDRCIVTLSLAGSSLPEFVTASFLVVIFGLQLDWFPVIASTGDVLSPAEQLYRLVLPILALVLVYFGYIARMARAGVITAMEAEYTRTAFLKGLPRGVVIRRHVLRNALLPTISVVATQTGYLFGGLLAVELIFNYNGLGRELVRAALTKDLPVLSAGVLLIGVVYMIATLLGDILISILNPRVRLGDQ
ncbi:MAG: peptide ABC transporter permease [Thermoleophilia bacterium]|jgi:peptide/nickel transport system permease protein|nr:MAG: peptide ABC transporter permease [Thermoleophilia bacterium]